MSVAKYRVKDLVVIDRHVAGYPAGLCIGAFCRIAEIQKVGLGRAAVQRFKLVRDDGREGMWWVDADAFHRPGEAR